MTSVKVARRGPCVRQPHRPAVELGPGSRPCTTNWYWLFDGRPPRRRFCTGVMKRRDAGHLAQAGGAGRPAPSAARRAGPSASARRRSGRRSSCRKPGRRRRGSTHMRDVRRALEDLPRPRAAGPPSPGTRCPGAPRSRPRAGRCPRSGRSPSGSPRTCQTVATTVARKTRNTVKRKRRQRSSEHAVARLHPVEAALEQVACRVAPWPCAGRQARRQHRRQRQRDSAEAAMAIVTTTANSLNMRPTTPPMSSTGMNTATSESVIERMVKPISPDALERRLERRHALLDVADDVLEHDDGVVDDEADRQRQAEQRDVVDRVAEQRTSRRRSR